MKYLPLYFEWMRTGYIPRNGLCNVFIGNRLFKRMTPYKEVGYWAYDGTTLFTWCCTMKEANDVMTKFTPLRQNIVLLMAAINKEL